MSPPPSIQLCWMMMLSLLLMLALQTLAASRSLKSSDRLIVRHGLIMTRHGSQDRSGIRNPEDAMKVLFNKLNETSPVTQKQLEEAGNKITERGAEMVREDISALLSSSSRKCPPNLMADCPLGWAPSEDICVAPGGYGGPCSRQMKFKDRTMEERRLITFDCTLEWPCLGPAGVGQTGSCEKDYSVAYPDGFSVATDGFNCLPNSLVYRGPCQFQVSFVDMSPREKQQWVDMCSTSWPCSNQCVSDMRSLCPSGWVAVGEDGFCEPPQPNRLTVDCAVKRSFTYWTPQMKKSFAETCRVTWPCKVDCPPDLSSRCPEGWTFDSRSGECREVTSASNFSSNVCGITAVDFRSVSLPDRLSFSVKCRVRWPCLRGGGEDCEERDWRAKCPFEWKAMDDSQRSSVCQPPSSQTKLSRHIYNPTCFVTQTFNSWSETDRRKWASDCRAPWPCLSFIDRLKAALRAASGGGWEVGPKNGREAEEEAGPVDPSTGAIVPLKGSLYRLIG